MADIDELYIKITADGTQLENGLNKAQGQLDGFGNHIKKVGEMLVAAFSVYAIYDYTKEALAAYDGMVKAEAKVAQAIKQTGGAAKLSYTELRDEADKLKGLTLFDDDKILNDATAQLLTFTNIAGDNFKRAQIAAMNLSTVLDGDLKSASIQVGKALNDPVMGLKALSRSGVQFSAEQTALIKSLAETNHLAEAQTIILNELDHQYGGQAEAAANVDAKFTKVGITIEDLTKTYGQLVAAWSKELPKGAQIMVGLLSATLKGMIPDDYTEDARRTVDSNTKIWASLKPGTDVAAQLAKVKDEYNKLKGVISGSKFGPDSGKNLNAQFAGQGFLDDAYAAAQKRLKDPGETKKKDTTYADLKAQLSELQKERDTATESEIKGINQAIAAKEKEIKKWEESGKAIDGQKGSIKALNEELKALTERRDNATGTANTSILNELISKKEKEIEELKKASAEWVHYGTTVSKSMTDICGRADIYLASLNEIDTKRNNSLKSNEAYLKHHETLAKKELADEKAQSDAIKGIIINGLAGAMQASMDAAVSGGNVGKALLGTFGGILKQLGQLLIVQGLTLLAAKMSLKTMNPYLALAAGAAAMLAGAAFSNAASHMSDGMGSGGSSASSGGGYGSSGGTNVFDTRGLKTQGSNEIVLKVQGRDLVAVTNANNLYYNRKG